MSDPQRALIAYLRSRRDRRAWLSLGHLASGTNRTRTATARTCDSLVTRGILERSDSGGVVFHRLREGYGE